ncbi:hypothetical protein XBI1_3080027 [Xenorhabdus bovienii str. Intermedium]|uniref:Uncharacterized protein n=1 Tax=Xenorhabdus bovienii str. Intermedium TaxID=1379677 RepID=A0A077QM98_XENBV|nr:hypothetical protein XBI1_3080027 [Xenorhabdus bovienii str. Intermedium]
MPRQIKFVRFYVISEGQTNESKSGAFVLIIKFSLNWLYQSCL